MKRIDYVTTRYIVPAGHYVLGDPCYAVPDNLWSELLESCDCFEDSAVGHAGGHNVLAFSTAYGDGEYYDDDGRGFGVDAGLIGLVPVAMMTEKEKQGIAGHNLSHYVSFSDSVECWAEDGVLHFGETTIDTNGE